MFWGNIELTPSCHRFFSFFGLKTRFFNILARKTRENRDKTGKKFEKSVRKMVNRWNNCGGGSVHFRICRWWAACDGRQFSVRWRHYRIIFLFSLRNSIKIGGEKDKKTNENKSINVTKGVRSGRVACLRVESCAFGVLRTFAYRTPKDRGNFEINYLIKSWHKLKKTSGFHRILPKFSTFL